MGWVFGGLFAVAIIILAVGLMGRPRGQSLVEERVGGKTKEKRQK
jgi:hypothetical protein